MWPLGYLSLLTMGALPTAQCSSSSTTDAAGHSIVSPEVCTGLVMPPALATTLGVVLVLAPLLVGGLLLVLAHRRARAERVAD